MLAEILLSLALSTNSTPNQSNSSYLSVQKLAAMCRGVEKGVASEDHLMCLAFVAGFVGGHEASVELAGARRIFCLPELVTQEQRALVFVKWAYDNPKHLHVMAEAGVALAFAENFSCRGNQ